MTVAWPRPGSSGCDVQSDEVFFRLRNYVTSTPSDSSSCPKHSGHVTFHAGKTIFRLRLRGDIFDVFDLDIKYDGCEMFHFLRIDPLQRLQDKTPRLFIRQAPGG